MALNSKQIVKLQKQRYRSRNTRKQKHEKLKHRRKPGFTKRIGGNADFYKPVLNKIMTTRE